MAQIRTNQLNIGFDAGGVINEYYKTQFPAGFGLSLKGVIGMPMDAQLSLSGSYLYFPLNSNYILPDGENISLHQIPVFLGYRVYRQSFFFEPQLGGALLINNNKNITGTQSTKNLQFAFAAEIGYVFNQLELSLRYQQSGGSPYQMAFLGARVAYIIGGDNY
ncbi:hypothetical protein ADICYQ_3868 [Cyclobacterium qasimii M12-11B]|uniref:Outer membrane protein beta-barrel domain-containing protein n=1 Tax=Cyclobacterium qasimii M12-11B TaxID=641524 RepID=S7WSB2_9BACT|nr:hypothetical protein ADICYQ_3868 [Cyclobacterium qasimii M12-11B]